jgi:hypothetical protein
MRGQGGAMQGSSYFRHQADTCLRFSASCTDQSLADRFQVMADDFIAKALDAEIGDNSKSFPLLHVRTRERLTGPS